MSGPSQVVAVCPTTYTVPPSNNPWLIYEWYLNGTLVQSGPDLETYTVDWTGTSGGTVMCRAVGLVDGHVFYTVTKTVTTVTPSVSGFGGEISSPFTPFCASGQTYTYTLNHFSGLPAGSTISWTAPFGATVTNASGASANVQFANNAYTGPVTATVTTPCGSVLTYSRVVTVTPGLPPTPPIIGPEIVCHSRARYSFR